MCALTTQASSSSRANVMIIKLKPVSSLNAPLHIAHSKMVLRNVRGRTVQEAIRSIMFQAKVPDKFWSFAAKFCQRVLNARPHSANKDKTPNLVFGDTDDIIKDIRIFGCAAHVIAGNPNALRKLDKRATLGIYLGPDNPVKTDLFFMMDTHKIVRRRDAAFIEDIFPFVTVEPVNEDVSDQSDTDSDLDEKTEDKSFNNQSDSNSNNHPFKLWDLSDDSDTDEREQRKEVNNDNKLHSSSSNINNNISSNNTSNSVSNPQLIPSPVIPNEERKDDLNNNDPVNPVKSHLPREQPTRSSTRQTRGMPPVRLLPQFMHLLTDIPPDAPVNDLGLYLTLKNSLSGDPEPSSYSEAMLSDEADAWKHAAKLEFDALQDNGTWELTPRPQHRKVIKGKWVFKRKLNAQGKVAKHKARFVAKGCQQIPGFDFEDTFAPVAKFKTLRVILALAAILGLALYQLDVQSAYLNGKIDKEIYMEQPEGFNDNSGRVCLLRRSIYGLKQAGRLWNEDLNLNLVQMGFKRLISDSCVYILRENQSFLILAVYVDDMVLASNDEQLFNRVFNQLSATYKITKPSDGLQWILGVRVTRDPVNHTVTLDQEQFSDILIKRYKMEECKPSDTPAVTKEEPPLQPDADSELIADPSSIRSLEGSFQYIYNITRPDMAFAVNAVCQTMHLPDFNCITKAKRIVRYLKRTVKLGITYDPAFNSLQLHGYSDANWGPAPDRRSTSGFVFYLAGAPVSWQCRRQRTTALSSTEAEYLGISDAVKELLWLRYLMGELGFPQGPNILFIDNKSAISIASNDVSHDRTKHIDIRHAFIRDHVKSKNIKLQWISTDLNHADIFTKALPYPAFKRHRDEMLNTSRHHLEPLHQIKGATVGFMQAPPTI